MKNNNEKNTISRSCRCGKISDFDPIVYNVKSMPIDHVKQKIAKNHCLLTCKSYFDFDDQKLHIEHMINANSTEMKSYTFKEIATEFGWKSFEISEDLQTVYPIF